MIRSPAEMAQPPKGEAGSHRALEMWERELIETPMRKHDFGPAAMVMLYAGFAGAEVLYLVWTGMRTFRRKRSPCAAR